ncbi:MAG: GNAT family N-acetyltransferase [Ginsengibacter sp.]
MTSIVAATEDDTRILCELSKQTLMESHGNSAPEEDLDQYILENYNEKTIRAELKDPKNIYYLLYHNEELVGYSKIILNVPYKDGVDKNMAKLNRIFLLKKVYDQKLGVKLLTFNINLLKQHHQAGVWLYTWTENERAIKFYKKNGFKIVGSHDFKISDNHINPNHLMFLDFSK